MTAQAWFHFAAATALLLAMTAMLARLLAGPTLYDRVLAANSFGTKTVLFLCLYGFIIGRSDGVDVALLYALVNFISAIAILKFFRYRALGLPLVAQRGGGDGAAQ